MINKNLLEGSRITRAGGSGAPEDLRSESAGKMVEWSATVVLTSFSHERKWTLNEGPVLYDAGPPETGLLLVTPGRMFRVGPVAHLWPSAWLDIRLRRLTTRPSVTVVLSTTAV